MCNTVHGINYNYIYYIYCTVLPEDGLPQLSVFLPLKLFLPQRKKDKKQNKNTHKNDNSLPIPIFLLCVINTLNANNLHMQMGNAADNGQCQKYHPFH